MNDILIKLKHLPYVILKARRSGLKKHKPDPRDFQTSELGWFGYTPKNKKKVIPTVTIKNQQGLQTCQWNATTVQKEVDEGVPLSVRSLVCKGKQMGLVGSMGLSNLRSGQEVLQKWGILEESQCPNDFQNSWNTYIGFNLANADQMASKHKIKSYWSVSSVNDVYKLIDDGRVLTTGMAWYSGFNQGGGFGIPWIINKIIGWFVGGHAVAVKGYDTNYKGLKCFIIQNSYGKEWGDGGDFYVEESYFAKQLAGQYGCFVNLDIEKDLVAFIRQYEGKNVKGDGSNGIFLIENGKKRAYPNADTFFAFNVDKIKDSLWNDTYVTVAQTDLDKVPEGDPLDITKSSYYEALQHIKRPFDLTN